MNALTRRRAIVAAVLSTGTAMAGCADPLPASQAPAEASPTQAATAPGTAEAADPRNAAVLRLDFAAVTSSLEGGALVEDSSGNGHYAVVQTSEPGGQARPVTGPDDEPGALQFPGRCDPRPDDPCPRVVLEVADAPEFNPGEADFSWGAQILMTGEETSQGSNVVQKGFANGGGSQWKLQVDGEQGRPSCVVVGQDQADIHVAEADVSIADGGWHDVVCHRTDDEIVVVVDGQPAGSAPLPPGVVVAPPGPVRVAGKNARQDNDQFFGAVADVFYTVSVA